MNRFEIVFLLVLKMFCHLSFPIRGILIFVLAVASGFAGAFNQYSFVDLGPETSGSFYNLGGFGATMNRSGNVAFSTPTASGFSALRWQNGVATSLQLPGEVNEVDGMNTLGAMCGYWGTISVYQQEQFNAFVLQPNGTLVNLPPLDGYDQAVATAINDSGIVVGASSDQWDFFYDTATMWVNGVASPIPGMIGQSGANTINNLGMIGGNTSPDPNQWPQPCVFYNGVTTVLPLPDSRFYRGEVLAINDQGDAVGDTGNINAVAATLWRNGAPILLFPQEVYPPTSSALAINNLGQIVGHAMLFDINGDHGSGFIWENGQAAAFDSLVPNRTGDITSGIAINDDGQILVAASMFSYQNLQDANHLWLLTPMSLMGSISVNPSTVTAGSSTTVTVTIDPPAPAGGAVVGLSSTDPVNAPVPTSLSFAKGQFTKSFTVATHTMPIDEEVTFYASLNNTQVQTVLHILTSNPFLKSFLLTPNNTFDGQAVLGRVTLRNPAPTGGARITFTNSNPSVATCPSSVTIPRGATTASFTTTAHAPLVGVGTAMRATLGPVTIEQDLHVSPIVLQALNLTVTSVTGGATINGVVSTAIPAPSGGYKVTLASSNTAAATVPASVTIAAGRTSATFVVTTRPVGGTTFLNITASHGNSSLSRQIQVLPPEVSAFSVSPSTIQGGKRVTGSITLTGKAPTGGIAVNIQANPNLVSPLTTVVVAAGSNHVSFPMNTSTVGSTTVVTLHGSTFNVQKTTTLTLTH